MEIAGQYRLRAPREDAWATLLDPDALREALPGCQRLVVEDDGRFAVTMKIGVAAIKGTVDGRVELRDRVSPRSFTMAVNGRGSIGIASGTALVQLDDEDGATLVSVAGQVEILGLVASLGQRMLRGVAHRMIGQFFDSVDRQLQEQRPAPVREELR